MPIAMPATGRVIGTPASMSASVPAQTLAIEVEPFDASDSATMRIVYGKIIFVRQNCAQRFFGERTVADHAAVHAADASCLADTEGREVVMEHEGFLRLLVFDGVERAARRPGRRA